MKIDLARCIDAIKNIYVEGICNSDERRKVLADAIQEIQKNAGALKSGYIGVKQYSGFGDQRCDCEYGMGPRHGSIVFRIGRHDKCATAFGANEIYYLECERDFKPMKIVNEGRNDYEFEGNLFNVLTRIEKHTHEIEELEAHLKNQEVEAHV